MRFLTSVVFAAIASLVVSESVAQQRFTIDASPAPASQAVGIGRPVFVRPGTDDHQLRFVSVAAAAVVFEDSRGVRRYAIDGKIVQSSVTESAQFLAAIVLGDASSAQSSELSLQVFSFDAGPIYRLPLRHDFGEPFPGVSVDERDGSIALLHHAEGRVDFYSAAGAIVEERHVTTGPYEIERTILASRARTSGHLAVAVNEPVTDGVHSVAAGHVRIFNPSGAVENVFEIPQRALSALAIAPDGKQIVIGAYDVPANVYRTTFLDDTGAELHWIDLAAEVIEFDETGRHVLVSDKRRLSVVEFDVPRNVLDFQLREESDRVFSSALSPDGNTVVLLVGQAVFTKDHFRHDDLRVVEFVRVRSGEYISRTRPLDQSAEYVEANADLWGVSVVLDQRALVFMRP
ncbi:MAG: hypothetical protein HKN37_06785 [Rhodothermales bacterium]|nr:hypothetical protein [Rhodothermales bacterium]